MGSYMTRLGSMEACIAVIRWRRMSIALRCRTTIPASKVHWSDDRGPALDVNLVSMEEIR